MKILVIASAIAMVMASDSAMAALGDTGSQGQVQFVGTIAAKTCDVVVDGSGAVNSLVQFGTVDVGKTVTKEFSVKLKDPTCIANMTKAHFLWASSNFNSKGIINQSGSASEARVKLNAKNDAGGNTTATTQDITGTSNAVEFAIADATKGFGYTAELNAGNVPGTFET